MIFLGSFGSIALYWAMQTSSTKKDSQVFELERLRTLRAESRLIAGVAWKSVEAIRDQALALQQNRSLEHPVLPSGDLLYWAEVQTRDGHLESVTQSAMNPAWKSARLDPSYIKLVAERLNYGQLAQKGAGFLRARKDPQGSSEWGVLAFPVPAHAETVVLAWIEPQQVFSFLERFENQEAGKRGEFFPAMRGYLVAADGRVLAHSQSSYKMADFAQTQVFTEGVLRIFQLHSPETRTGQFRSIDQNLVVMSATRLDPLPLAIVVEQMTVFPSSVSTARGLFTRGLILFFLALLPSIGGVWFLLRKRNDYNEGLDASLLQIGEADEFGIPTIRIDDGSPILEAIEDYGRISENVAHEITEATPLKASLQAEVGPEANPETSSMISQFDQKVALTQDPRSVVKEMTETAAKLCKSPTLFFVFRSEISAAILLVDAGFPQGGAPATMSFSVSHELLKKIEISAQAGEIFMIGDYEPLSDILLARTGVAHFEAWAVTGYGRLGRQAGKPKLLGILVVLQAGMDSIAHQDSLKRMVRSTGLVYENALLSQG